MKQLVPGNFHGFSRAAVMVVGGLLATSCFLLTPLVAQAELPSNYNDKTAEEKQSILWDNIVANQTLGQLSITQVTGLEIASLLNPCTLWDTFQYRSDEAKPHFVKRIHANGTVAKIEWIPANQTTYTGLFQTGGLGLLRASLADTHANVDLSKTYAPGFALKIFIDGDEEQPLENKASVNFIAMYGLSGQPNRNFFENKFSNVIPAPTGLLKFAAAGFDIVAWSLGLDNATTLPTYEGARVERNGHVIEDPVAPYQIVYTPTEEARNVIPASGLLNKDMREQLRASNFRDGRVLYTVSAIEKGGSTKTDLGRIVLRSDFVPSEYGDKHLFFKHQLPKTSDDPSEVL